MERTRIVLVALPRMLREIIERAVGGQPDMEIVATSPDEGIRVPTLARARADVVISGGAGDAAALEDVLLELPRLKVLLVSGDGRDTALWELRPARTPLGQASAQMIVDAIRGRRRATTS